jgi:hypothetical protein
MNKKENTLIAKTIPKEVSKAGFNQVIKYLPDWTRVLDALVLLVVNMDFLF